MPPRFHLVGDAALNIEWPQGPQANALARGLHASLLADPPVGYQESLPALQSLLVRFDPLTVDPKLLELALIERLQRLDSTSLKPGRLWRIPVCYNPECGLDIEALATAKKMTPERLAELHAAKTYTALFLGFLPGFAYLGGLDEALSAPRHEKPRTTVPSGSVALAGELTAIYPLESPGGWQIIGRTPVKMFDAARPEHSLLAPGDEIQFFPITLAAFASS
jgi:KipI family sensor histidine kinase inhibitor